MNIPYWMRKALQAAQTQVADRLVRWSTVTVSSNIKGRYEIKGRGRDDTEPDYQHPLRLVQHYGFRSRPGPGTEVVGVAPGGVSAQRVGVATEAPGLGPQEQPEWEVELYAKWGQRILLTQDGRLTLLTAAGNRAELLEDGGLALKGSAGHKAELLADGKIRLTSKGGAVLTMDDAGKVSDHDELFRSTHFGGRGGKPTVATPAGGGALGNGGAVVDVLTEGTDTAFRFTAQVDPMTPGGPGDIAEVTFAKKFSQAPRGVSIQPANDAAALVLVMGSSVGGGSYYYSVTDGKLIVKTTATLFPAATLAFSVIVIE